MYRLFLASIFLISACATQQKHADRAHRFFRENPLALASLCADQYPVHNQYKPGTEHVHIDTITTEAPPLPCPPQNRFYKCPPSSKIVQRITRIDTLFRENTARVVQLRTQLEQCTQKALLAKIIAKKLTWWFSSVTLVGLGFLAFVFMRFRILR
ncbi:MAG: hypothetical protein E6Q66_04640 [Pedobacter sp.]|nr:MAG: hypothetical protein E6Q66_04640 [Pedobacter sp.]